MIARDRNLGDAVDVLPADDPGLPNGARLCPAALYDASNPAVSLCNVGNLLGDPATDPRLACSGNASQAHARFPAGAARAGCMRAGPPRRRRAGGEAGGQEGHARVVRACVRAYVRVSERACARAGVWCVREGDEGERRGWECGIEG